MSKITIGVVGILQSGKSLMINCLLGRQIATIGDGRATTHAPTFYSYSKDEYAEIKVDGKFEEVGIDEVGNYDTSRTIEYINIFLNNPILKLINLVDLPGSDFDDKDNSATLRVLPVLDCAILVATNVKGLSNESTFYKSILSSLQKENIPYYAFLNCTLPRKWDPNSSKNNDVAKADFELFSSYPPIDYDMDELAIRKINLMWYWCSVAPDSDILKNQYEDLLERHNAASLKDDSNFLFVKDIFSENNLKILKIRKDFRYQLGLLQNMVCPVGTIQAFAFESIPAGWLPCEGQEIPQEIYGSLYNVIGNKFGNAKDGLFCLPDLRGRFIRGWDKSSIRDENRDFGSIQEDSIQKHSHKFDESVITAAENGNHYHPLWCDEYETITSVSGWGVGSTESYKRMCYPTTTSSGNKTDLGPYGGKHTHSISKSGNPVSSEFTSEDMRIANETRPKNLALNFCIKAYEVFGRSIMHCIDLDIDTMKCVGTGVYERFIWLDKPFLITSKKIPLQYPLYVESRDEMAKEISVQRINRYDPIQIKGDGLYFVRIVRSNHSEILDKLDHVEIFKINSLGIIGDFNNWEKSIPLSSSNVPLVYETEVELPTGKYEFKFRANDNWSVELSGKEHDLVSWLGDNLILESDGHRIKVSLDLSNHPWHFCIESL